MKIPDVPVDALRQLSVSLNLVPGQRIQKLVLGKVRPLLVVETDVDTVAAKNRLFVQVEARDT